MNQRLFLGDPLDRDVVISYCSYCDPLDHDAIIPFTYKKQCTLGLDSKNRIDKDATKFYQLWSGLKESLKGGGECDDAEEDKLLAGHGVSTLNPADKNGQESRQKAQ